MTAARAVGIGLRPLQWPSWTVMTKLMSTRVRMATAQGGFPGGKGRWQGQCSTMAGMLQCLKGVVSNPRLPPLGLLPSIRKPQGHTHTHTHSH